jgi:hypothetical protein
VTPTPAALLLVTVVIGAAAGCESRPGNFSQYPGFAAYFAAHPPAHELPSATDSDLLRRYRPRLWLPAGHPGPIDFYVDYIAAGRLTDGAGRPAPRPVTRAILGAHVRDPGAVFVHEPGTWPPTRTVYGRVDRDVVRFPADGGPVEEESFTFLTYHFVFRVSGLPAAVPAWQGALLRLVGSLEDWHQLDHFTAVTIVLDGALRPMAMMLQEHNNLRTHLLGVEVPWPLDGRVPIDVAIRSNELYPHRPGRTRRRAVSRPDPAAIRYLMTGERRPFVSADDVTEPAAEVEYALAFLPPDDAFYTFQGYLGERRWLGGRSGPPGADFNSRPALKPRGVQLLAYYWRDGDPDDLARLEASLASPEPLAAFARLQAPVFHRRWRSARPVE